MNTLFVPATPDDGDASGAANAVGPLHTAGDPSDEAHSFTTSTGSQLPPERSFGDSYERELLGTQMWQQTTALAGPAKQALAPQDGALAHDQTSTTEHSSIFDPDLTTATDRSGERESQLGDFGETQLPAHDNGLCNPPDALAGDDSEMQDYGELSMVMATAEPLEERPESQLEPTLVDDEPLPVNEDDQDDDDEDNDDNDEPQTVDSEIAPSAPQADNAHRDSHLLQGPHASHSAFDQPSAPSSSAVVARDLLSPKKYDLSAPGPDDEVDELPSSTAVTEAEPQSSADPDMTKSGLFPPSPRKHARLDQLEKEASGQSSGARSSPDLSRSRGDASGRFSGPETSTPAHRGAPLPHPPLTVQRTLPEFNRLGEMMITSPFVRPSAKSTASAPKAVYQSAAIVKHLAVKRRKPAPDIWQDSDDTEPMDEDVEEAEAHAESDGEKDMTIDESETVDELESQGSGAATPRPTANATTDMDLDEDASALLHRQPDDSLEPKDESLGQSIGASAPPAAQQTSVDEPSSLASSIYQPIHADTPPFGPEINDESQSQSQSLDLARNNESSLQDGTQEDSHSRRLTDISELKSSMEMQESSQIVVEPTQVEYDIEVYNNMTNASDETSRSRALPPFIHDASTSTDNSTGRRSFPPRGRELSRRPPPPSSLPITAESQDESQESPFIPLRLTTATNPSPAVSPAKQDAETPSSPPVALAAATANLSIPSTAASHPTSNSSNGIVPDSQVPSEEPAAQPAASDPAATAPSGSLSANGQAVQPAAFYAGGAADPDQAEPEADDNDDDEREDDLDDIVPVATKGKGKGTATAKSKGKGKAVPAPKNAAGSKAKSRPAKGKGKGKQAADSPDELDLLDKDAPAADDDGDDEPFFQETNYEDPPHLNTTRRTSRGRTSAASASAPSPVAVGKRRQSNAAVEAPAPKRPKAAPAKKAVPKADAAPKKKPGRPRKNAARGASASASVEPENAVAGPSRVRFQDDADGDGDVDTDGGSEQSAGPETKPGKGYLKSRLPSSAPFKRVFGYYPPTEAFYPCTILKVVGGELKVQFDDKTKGSLKYDDARRCELEVGDGLAFNGEDVGETETQQTVLLDKIRVIRVERGTSGNNATGELFPDDVVVVTPCVVPPERQDAPEKKERVMVEAILVPSSLAAQLDNRKLTPGDIAGLEGRDRNAKLALLTVEPEKGVTAVEVNPLKTGLFSGYGFIVTEPDSTTKTATFDKQLSKHGGTKVSLEQLFDVVLVPESAQVALRFDPAAFADIHTILLLTDSPHTTPKYLVALALGIPCVSMVLVSDSIKNGAVLNWRHLALTAGFSKRLDAWIVGGQNRALTKTAFDLGSISAAVPGGLFSGSAVLCVIPKKGKKVDLNQLRAYQRILAAAGATKIDFVTSAEAALDASDYKFVLLEEESTPSTKALDAHAGVRTLDWLKASLIQGIVLDA